MGSIPADGGNIDLIIFEEKKSTVSKLTFQWAEKNRVSWESHEIEKILF